MRSWAGLGPPELLTNLNARHFHPWTQISAASRLLPPSQWRVAAAFCFVTFAHPLLIPQPPAVISGRVLGDGGSNNREANSPAHSSSCPHFKTSRRPSSVDPDLNPTLLSAILRLLPSMHWLRMKEKPLRTVGQERNVKNERVCRGTGLFTTDGVFLPPFAA